MRKIKKTGIPLLCQSYVLPHLILKTPPLPHPHAKVRVCQYPHFTNGRNFGTEVTLLLPFLCVFFEVVRWGTMQARGGTGQADLIAVSSRMTLAVGQPSLLRIFWNP